MSSVRHGLHTARTTADAGRYNDAILRSIIGGTSGTTLETIGAQRAEDITPNVTKYSRGKDYFFFHDRRGKFDWRALATVDVDRVTREVLPVIKLSDLIMLDYI
jgi:hypothetical protein